MAKLSEWTKQHLCQITQDFESADKYRNGYLSFEDVCDVLEDAGFNGSICDARVSTKTLKRFLSPWVCPSIKE